MKKIISLPIIYPRIHAILSKESPYAIVIRRGPSKQVASFLWNRQDDSFVLGQWLKGRIYQYRCDISPDGKHWMYFAMDRFSKTMTVVAKTPYLKALDFITQDDVWNGGGLFKSNTCYWFNKGCNNLQIKNIQSSFPQTHEPYISSKKKKALKKQKQEGLFIQHKRILEYAYSGMNIINQYGIYENVQSECPFIYFQRLLRDGWIIDKEEKHKTFFSKKINSKWTLINIFNNTLEHPIGKGCYYETYVLQNTNSENISMFDWEWADVDGERIVWAEKGCIYCGYLNNIELIKIKELYSFNNMEFIPIKAPY